MKKKNKKNLEIPTNIPLPSHTLPLSLSIRIQNKYIPLLPLLFPAMEPEYSDNVDYSALNYDLGKFYQQ